MVGPWIRERRKALDLTQAELAGRIGVSQVQISSWETNKHTPSSSHMEKLLAILGPAAAPAGPSPAAPLLRALTSVVVGDFVTVDAESGVGKICAFDAETATVGFFRSLDLLASTRQVPRSELTPVRLTPQTRCFFQGTDRRWFVGRIGETVCDGEYEVLLPDQRACFVPTVQLYVRSAAPVDDPLEVLVLGAQESPFLHDRRHTFLLSLVEQRAVAHGMNGLLSARIDLYPHQVEVVRRVLEDPIQRYLLADEVGLGKTIEAGVILRQYLLDDATASAVVIVPPMLVEQWRRELDEKFRVFAQPGAVRLLAADDFAQIDALTSCGLLILDEAHHVAALAFADDDPSRRQFDTFCRLARSADRVLLLSATPVLRHERDFLAMLHLLDPERYRLTDLEAFRRRVEKRQAVGRTLRALREDLANPTLIKLNLGTLRGEFKEDSRLAALADEVERATSAGSAEAVRRGAIRALRVHISETYRLHRRMARTRRKTVEDGRGTVVAPRVDETNKKASALIEEYDVDERSERVHDLLDAWRSSAAASLPMAGPSEIDAWAAPRLALRQIFLTLFESAGSWLEVLVRVVRCRRLRFADEELRRELGELATQALCETPLFDGELKILDDLLDVLEPAPRITRIEQMVEVVRNIARSTPVGSKPPKVAIFTSFTLACRELTARFTSVFGSTAVASHQIGRPPGDVERDVARFCDSDSECRYLIADRSGEEGRNLQSADIMVHFDLPWSANRLEQRIGRLDRIGRARGIRARVCLGPDCDGSMFDAWYRMLRDGLGVFHSSIAALQFFVDERLSSIGGEFFAGGTSALEAAIDPLQTASADEHARLSDQDAVDEIDALVRDGRGYAQSIAEFDRRHEEAERAMHGWVAEALAFSDARNADAGTVRYAPSPRSLVPTDVLLGRFAPFLRGYLATYDREVCTMMPGVALLRVGDPFVDAFAEYLRWDDRGQAFAVWRQVKSWPSEPGAEWVGFRFNYLIEADVDAARSTAVEVMPRADLAALRRRADAWFPPTIRTLFVDSTGTEVHDPEVLAVLSAPYVSVENGGRDTNLAKERVVLIETCVDRDRWPAFCRGVRAESYALLLASPWLRTTCEQHAAQAERELAARSDQLRLRLQEEKHASAASQSPVDELAAEGRVGEALIAGVRQPRIRLDSVGFFVVSGRHPPGRRAPGGAQ